MFQPALTRGVLLHPEPAEAVTETLSTLEGGSGLLFQGLYPKESTFSSDISVC